MNDNPVLDATRAVAFIEHCFAGRMDAAIGLAASDATWWVIGDPAKVKVSGLKDRPRIERMLGNLRVVFPDGMQGSIDGVTARRRARRDRGAVDGASVAISSCSIRYERPGCLHRRPRLRANKFYD